MTEEIIDQLIDEVNKDVYQERYRQNQKWGVQRHNIGTWLSILGEEFGEVCQAAQANMGLASVKETDADDLYEECIHVAAVASAIAEQIKEQKMNLNTEQNVYVAKFKVKGDLYFRHMELTARDQHEALDRAFELLELYYLDADIKELTVLQKVKEAS